MSPCHLVLKSVCTLEVEWGGGKAGIENRGPCQHVTMSPGSQECLRIQDAVCTILFPKIDSAVSTRRNHLLKTPFSAHASTGRVSIPIFNDRIYDFDPSTCPMVNTREKMPDSFFQALRGFIDFYLKFQLKHKKRKSRYSVPHPSGTDRFGSPSSNFQHLLPVTFVTDTVAG